MEKKVTEKVKTTGVTYYYSLDGKRFKTAEACIEYEKSAIGVAMSNLAAASTNIIDCDTLLPSGDPKAQFFIIEMKGEETIQSIYQVIKLIHRECDVRSIPLNTGVGNHLIILIGIDRTFVDVFDGYIEDSISTLEKLKIEDLKIEN